MNIAREFYDMILVGYLNHFSFNGFGMMATFLVFLIPYIFALKNYGSWYKNFAKKRRLLPALDAFTIK